MSSYERPDRAALAALEPLVARLEDELGSWRRRSLKAEAEVQELRTQTGVVSGPDLIELRARLETLTAENGLLRQRMATAREQVDQLRTRLRFLEDREADGAA